VTYEPPSQPQYGQYSSVPGNPDAREQLARYAEEVERTENPPASLGSRLVGYLLALVVGAAYGAIGTVAHVNSISVFGVSVPLGLMIAVIGAGALLIGLRLVFDDRIAALCAAVGMVGMIALFTLPSAGGTVLIPGIVGVVWTLTTVLIATLVAVWPKLPPRRPSGS
jgi:hypothetical protein